MCIEVFFFDKILSTKTTNNIENRIATTSVNLQYNSYINLLINQTFGLCVFKVFVFFCLKNFKYKNYP